MQEITIDKSIVPKTEADLENSPHIVQAYVKLAKIIEDSNIDIEINAQPVLELTKETFLEHINKCVDIEQQSISDAPIIAVPEALNPLINETMGALWDNHVCDVGARHVAGFHHEIQPGVSMFVFEVFDAKSAAAISVNLINNSDMSVATDHGAIALSDEERAEQTQERQALLKALEVIGFKCYMVRGSTIVVEKVDTEAGCTIGIFFSEVAREHPLSNTTPEYISILTSVGNIMNHEDPEDPDWSPAPSVRLWHEATDAFMKAVEEFFEGPTHLSAAAGYAQTKGAEENKENPAARVMVQDTEKCLALLTTTGDFLSNHEVAGTEEITASEYAEEVSEMTLAAALPFAMATSARHTRFMEYDKGLISLSAYWRDSEGVLEVCLKEVKPIPEEVMNAYLAERKAEAETHLDASSEVEHASEHTQATDA